MNSRAIKLLLCSALLIIYSFLLLQAAGESHHLPSHYKNENVCPDQRQDHVVLHDVKTRDTSDDDGDGGWWAEIVTHLITG